ncbi:aspartyl protease [Ancylomarina subtilis]|uniref:Aspartyl protease n=2 Tax=Ancylomarina subtilis TaxID=1639035 RepID=A0A4Q7V8W9_9BACT|nr:aspartyl protease [Ancylomarina subtilis]
MFMNNSPIHIPIEIIELETQSFHLLIKCTLNGEQDGDMVIDTGASKTVFDRNFVLNYQHKEKDKDELQSCGLGGDDIESDLVEIESLSFGDFKSEILNVVLIDLNQINKMYEKHCQRQICGLLGSDFLLRHQAIIDYQKSILILNKNQ